MNHPYIGQGNLSVPIGRSRITRPAGWYRREDDKWITSTPNPGGYPNETLDVPSLPEDQQEVYIEQIGELMYASLSAEIPNRVTRMKAYLERIAYDHFFSTSYDLPGSYWANMFHLLNPMHENSIHTFTLDGIKVERVIDYRETMYGGEQTLLSVLTKPSNIQRLCRRMDKDPLLKHVSKYINVLRRDSFQSKSILHGPYTVEQRIQLTESSYTSILFTLSPLGPDKCRLFIDFYSNFNVPHKLKWFLFHLITPVVVWEDRKYMRYLASKGEFFFGKVRREVPATHFLKLHQRFLELYGRT